MIFFYILFWTAFFLLIYPYTFYPIFLFIYTKMIKPLSKTNYTNGQLPLVSFIISAYNEEAIIETKLKNTLKLKYPKDKLEILVVSDASTDRTDEIVKELAKKSPNIKLIRQNERKGKTSGLNIAVRSSKGEVILFSDANAIYKDNALPELVKFFENPEIGYVVGSAVYNVSENHVPTQTENIYWKFELYIKELESNFHSVVGGDGAIYAIRKELYRDLDSDDINDFVNPLQIIAQGYRGIFNPEALCYEDGSDDFKKEFRRKVRIVNRSWRAVRKNLSLFSVRNDFRFLFLLFSHKVIRWYSLLIFGVLFLSNIMVVLNTSHLFYYITLIICSLSMLFAGIGFYFDNKRIKVNKLITLLYYFFLVSTASIMGIFLDYRGQKIITWDHIRS